MKKNIRKSLHAVEKKLDRLKDNYFKQKNTIKNIRLVSYYGYGNNNLINIEGRILKDRKITIAKSDDTIFENIERMYKHFNTIELSGVSITATYGNETKTTISDEEGYYKFQFPFQPNNNQSWHQVDLKLSEGQGFKATETGWIQTPVNKTNFGVISDIDDTIIQTGATNLLKSINTTFTKNALTRLPFLGVSEFYKGLQKGNTTAVINPLFYLSNSPWNFYDFLNEFMQINEIPKGTLLLRDWGLDDEKLIVNDNHKINTIINLLNTYPEIPFILIGDSGEKDPEYYYKIVQQFPNRILAIYIRDVSDKSRDLEVIKIAKQVNKLGVPMLLLDDTLKATEHAKQMKWIDKETLSLVKKKCSSINF